MNERSIFMEALEKDTPAGRAAYLDEACGGDAALRQRVEALLASHEQAGSFLGKPVPERLAGNREIPERGEESSRETPGRAGLGQSLTPDSPATIDDPANERPGTIIGPYKLLQQIGEGGMGTVFMAEQTHPVQRKVALKLIKSGMDSRQVLARFAAERQALALMDHPNIAKVLDAGATATGSPYFVMELVKGVPITKYCDEHHLTPRQRLELFVPVCQAVQHAHQKGIIHRDMKPSNVMVCIYDGKPVPKVIDFGVAKATGPKLTEQTLYTEFGAIVGTFEYMSPEQAQLDQLDIDTRSDIYSLGVLLYELLTGTTPLERKRMKEVAILELLRLVREEEAPRPSVRLSTAEGLPSIAANRGTEPKRLSGLMRGELDWIVMKCLEKDRNRRYDTANAFAADVLHYLNGEAVMACPPSASYRMRKFAQRNRAAFWTTGVVALALVTGTAVSVWQAVRATRALEAESRARQDADANFQTARKAVEDYFTVVSGSPLLDAPGLELLRKQLLDTALSYNLDFIQQHGEDPSLQADVAAAHIRVAEITYLVGGSADQWFPHVRDGADIIARLIEAHRDTPEVQKRLAKIRFSIGVAASEGGGTVDPQEVFRCFHKQVLSWEKLVKDNPNEPELKDGLAATYYYLAAIYVDVNEKARWSEKAIGIWEKLARENPKVASYRMHLAKTHEVCAIILRGAGRQQQADKETQDALLLRQELAREFPEQASHSAWLAASYRTLSEMHSSRNEPKEAEKTLRQALDLQEKLVADFPAAHVHQDELARTQLALAAVLQKLGRSQEAQAAYREALAGFERLAVAFPRAAHYQTQLLQAAKDLAQLLEVSGQPRKKSEVLDAVFAVYEKLTAQSAKTSEDLKAMAAVYQNLANLLRDSGQPKEAEKAYAKGLELLRKRAAKFPAIAGCREDLGLGCRAFADWLQGPEKDKEREQLLREAIKVFEGLAADFPNAPSHHYSTASTHEWLGVILAALRLPKESEEHYRKAIELLSTLPTDFLAHVDGRVAADNAFTGLTNLLKTSGRKKDAERLIHQAIDFYQKVVASHPPAPGFRQDITKQYVILAFLLQDMGQRQEAEEAYRRSEEAYEKLAADFPGQPSYQADYHDLLGQLYWSSGQWEKAAAEYTKAIELQPDRWESWYRRGQTYRDLQLLDKALTDFSRAIELNPQHAKPWLLGDAWHLRADIYGRLGQSDKEVVGFTTAIELNPGHYWHWLRRGMAYARLQQWPKTVADCTRAIELKTDFVEAWQTRGEAHAALGQWDKAVADYAKAIELNPASYAGVADQLMAKGRLQEAEQCCRQALRLFQTAAADKPDEAIRRVNVAYATRRLALALARNPKRIKEGEEQHRQCLALYEKLVADFPGNLQYLEEMGHSQRYLGWLLADTGRPVQAEAAFRAAVGVFEKLTAKDAIPYHRHMLADTNWHLANLLRAAQKSVEAEQTYRRAVAIHEKLVAEFPNDASYRQGLLVDYLELANLLGGAGQVAEAEKIYRELIKLDPKNAVAPNNLAWLLATCPDAKLRNPQQAVELARKAVELDPKQGNWWNTLGVAQYRAGDWKAAVAALEKSMELRQGGDSFDWFFLAMSRWQLGEKEEALKWQEKAVQWMEKNQPKNEELVRFRAESEKLLGIK